MSDIKHLKMEELETRLETIQKSPLDKGVLKMIVCRPEVRQ